VKPEIQKFAAVAIAVFFQLHVVSVDAAPFRGEADGATLYQLVGVASTASAERIDEAYEAGLAKLDPSQNPEAGSLDPDGSWLKNLKGSYAILSSTQKRSVYDGFLAQHAAKAGYGAQHIKLLERALRLARRQRGEQARLTAADLESTASKFVFIDPVVRRTRSGPPPFQGKPGGSTLYAILGISATADAERIEEGYEVALNKLAPKRNPNAKENDPDGSYLKSVKRAYAILSKLQKRAAYDNFLVEQTTKPGAGLQHLDWVETGMRNARRSRGSRARLTAVDIDAAREKSRQKKKVKMERALKPQVQMELVPIVPPTGPTNTVDQTEVPKQIAVSGPTPDQTSQDTWRLRCRLGLKELGAAAAVGVAAGAAGQTIIQNALPSAPSQTTKSAEVPPPGELE